MKLHVGDCHDCVVDDNRHRLFDSMCLFHCTENSKQLVAILLCCDQLKQSN